MTVLATGIGFIPEFRPTQRPACRHCGDPYLPVERSDKYCQRAACQAAKARWERERARRRGK